MDRRGRELFEVGHSREAQGDAHNALPHPVYGLIRSHHPGNESEFDIVRPRRAAGTAWRPKRSRLLLVALGLGLALGAAEETARHAGYAAELQRLARGLGFGIDQVVLTGHRFSYDRDIFDALDLANVRTFAALDTAAVKNRIERLPWIDKAEFSRVFPGRLDIRVTERTPAALWSRGGSLYLIDRTGRVLAAVSGETLPDLPRFAGEGAAAEAASLMETVQRYPDIARHLEEAERISERRWRLKLDNKTTLELPADDEVAALEGLARDPALAKRVATGNATLDFRGPGRVAIRPEPDATASVPAPNPGS